MRRALGMQDAICQPLALVAHGNAVLSGASLPRAGLQHSSFKFTEFVRFVDVERVGGRLLQRPVADDPSEWFETLKSRGCRGLLVRCVASQTAEIADADPASRFGAARRWLIEAVYPEGSSFWSASWKIGDQGRSDRRIWQVTYGSSASRQPSRMQRHVDADTAIDFLSSTLARAIAFARKHDLGGFANAFEAAAATLRATNEPDLRGLAPADSLPARAVVLLAAAQSAWVFGGPGSWNELSFIDEAKSCEYEQISSELYAALSSALASGVNLSYPEQRAPWWRLWSRIAA